jgi:hypothetical protein
MPVMLLAERIRFAERGAAPPATERPKPANPGKSRQPCGPQTADDIAIALALTARWMLVTGRRLHQRPLLHALPAEQLIDFWADDHITPKSPPLSRAGSGAPPWR